MALKIVFLLLTIAVAAHGQWSPWKQMPGAAVDISANGANVLVVGADSKSLFKWNWARNEFERLPGEGKKVAATQDGWHWIIGMDDRQYRWHTYAQKWEMIGPGAGKSISAVSRNQAVAVDFAGAAYFYDGIKWQAMQNKGPLKYVSIGQNDHRWAIGENNHVYKFQQYADPNAWHHVIKTNVASVHVERINKIVISDDQGDVFIWWDAWYPVPGKKCKKVSFATNKIYCIGNDMSIWYTESAPYNNAPTGWTRIQNGGGFDITARGREVLVVGSDGTTLWRSSEGKDIFSAVGGSFATAATMDGWHWNLGGDHKAWRYNRETRVWDQIGGPDFIHVSAGSKDRAMATNAEHKIFLWDGTGSWKQLPGLAQYTAIGEDDERWVINSEHGTYRWNHAVKNWDLIPGIGSTIDVINAQKVVKTDCYSNVLVWEGGKWVHIPGSCAKASINHDGLYCVANDLSMWKRKYPPLVLPKTPPPTPAPTPAPVVVTKTEIIYVDREVKVQDPTVLVIDENDPRLAEILADLAKQGK